VSELVTNVIRHAGTDHASVGVIDEGDVVRIEVSDPSPTPVVRGGNTDPLQPGGLGLGIVDSIAWRWGVVQAERGKTVWFELALPTIVAV
jgi:anti-sigma regulatory factor (Ser/Thr protein kinase)